MRPVTALTGTVAVIWVLEFTVKTTAATPPKVTDVTPLKEDPQIVTRVPTGPEMGLNEVIRSGTVTVKLDAEVAVPEGVVTLMGPVVAGEGTVAEIQVLLFTVKLAAMPLKRTAVAPVKFVP